MFSVSKYVCLDVCILTVFYNLYKTIWIKVCTINVQLPLVILKFDGFCIQIHYSESILEIMCINAWKKFILEYSGHLEYFNQGHIDH